MADRQRSSEEIRAEIERTRADMDETVQEIGYRLSPGQIVDQLWDRMRAGDAAGSMMEAVKQHPMPSLLVGLGLGWLMYEKTGQSEGERLRRKFGDDVGPGTYAPAEGRVGPYRGEQLGFGTDDGAGMAERLHSALDDAREAAAGAAERVGDAASSAKRGVSGAAASVRDAVSGTVSGARENLRHVAERTGERVDHLRERAGEARTRAGERISTMRAAASERAGQASARARDGATHAYDEQPLALGAVAFGLGLASGLAIPSTPVEDRAVGERSDRFKGEVRRTGAELYESARRVAGEASHAARESVSRQGVVDELKTRARMVAEEAKQAAMDAIQRDGVADTLKNRVRAIAQDASAAARDAAERERLDPHGLQERARESADRIRE